MNLSELQIIIGLLGSFGVGAIIAAIVIFLFIKSFIPSYLSEKGKNLATKEDVARITDEVEKVKSQYAVQLQEIIHQNTLLLEDRKERQQMRLAAVDRRLQAHQEAYTLWRKLSFNVHNTTCYAIVLECQEWWEKNSLYLSPEAREAFYQSYIAANLHKDLLQDRSNTDLIQKNWRQIIDCGEILVKGAQLPTMGENEIRRVSETGGTTEINAEPT